MPRVIIAGDLNPSSFNEAPFREGNREVILGDLAPEFDAADLRIANLEAPLLSVSSPADKSGPVLGAPDACINGIRSIGIDLVGLANNHTMDHGEEGLRHTLSVCAAHGVTCAGAGSDLAEASKIVVKNVNGHRIGVLALAEHEFGIATRTGSGVSPFDPVLFARSIARQKEDYDWLIVLIHGGNEYFRYPRPSLQQACRFLVELGADVVICQHSHIVGCAEEYLGRHILYGQGNFVFAGRPSMPKPWYEGLLVAVDFQQSEVPKLNVIPFVQSESRQAGIRRMTGQRLQDFEQDFHARGAEVLDPAIVERRWDEFCNEKKAFYLRRYGALHRLFRVMDKYTGFIRFLLGRRQIRLDHLNLVRCESHREALINILSRD